MEIVVVLPAPFGPRRPYVSPGAIANPTPSTACRSPNRFRRPVHARTGVAEAAAAAGLASVGGLADGSRDGSGTLPGMGAIGGGAMATALDLRRGPADATGHAELQPLVHAGRVPFSLP